MRWRSPLYFCWIAFISGACRCRFCIEWIWRTVSGSSAVRTMIVSATIAQAHVNPIVVVQPEEDLAQSGAWIGSRDAEDDRDHA